MNILLINPPGNEFVRAGSRWPHKRRILTKRNLYFPFPFALAYAASTLKKAGHVVSLKDCPVLQWGLPELKAHISEFKPGLVIMETSAPSFNADMATAAALHPLPTCAAGFHATALPALHLEKGFDYVFCGEYEYHILDLAHALEDKTPLPPFIGHRDRIRPSHAPLIDNLELLPWPQRENMPLKAYHDPFSRGFDITVMSSKGCPFHCSFCTLTPYLGRTRYRMRDPVKVVDEIEFLRKQFRPGEILFDDDTITVNKDHLLSLCREITNRLPGLCWSCMGNVPVDDETASAMARAGCRAIKLGVESGSQAILNSIPKQITLQEISETFAVLKKHHISRHATIMAGFPAETPTLFDTTMNFVLSLDPDTVQFSTVIPYPGTKLYCEAVDRKWLLDQNWEDYSGAGGSPLSYPCFSNNEIKEAYRRGLRKWHRHMILHKPGTLLHHLWNFLK